MNALRMMQNMGVLIILNKKQDSVKTYKRPGETTSVLHKCQNCNPASLGPPHPDTDIFIHMTVAKNWVLMIN